MYLFFMVEKILTLEEKKQRVFSIGKKHIWLQCPMCNKMIPQVVKVDQDNKPLNPDEKGAVFKEINGVVQRRFSGPGMNYMPVHARYLGGRLGSYTKPEESMSPNILKSVDHELYKDFLYAIQKVNNAFHI